MTTEKPPGRSRRGRGSRSRRRRPAAPPPEAETLVAPHPLDDDATADDTPTSSDLVVETLASDEPPAELPATAAPEPSFAARYAPPVPRPLPSSRRAVFFDVENTSRPEHVAHVLSHLALDRIARATDLIAVGNWRVVSHETARFLARHGAQLVHSAPSVGVRDWSDLRIAVAAGVWLASARPGDSMEVVTDDQAFDAVGDVAASLGVTFRRLSYRALAGIVGEMPVEEPAGDGRSRRRRRNGRRGGHRGGGSTASAAVANGLAASREPQTAPHDELLAVVRELIAHSPERTISLDALSNALKARGFSRPPGSPRLITRLRRIKEIEVNRAGTIRLVNGMPAPIGVAESSDEASYRSSADAAEGDSAAAEGEEPAVQDEQGANDVPRPAARRRRRRGGRRRRGRGGQSASPPA